MRLGYEASFTAATMRSDIDACVGRMTDADGNYEEWPCTVCEEDGKQGFALVSPVDEFAFPACQPIDDVMRATLPKVLVEPDEDDTSATALIGQKAFAFVAMVITAAVAYSLLV